MKFSFIINLFLAQCWSVYALDQNIPVSDEYQRRVQEVVSEIPVEMPVSYDCRFINRWTSARHPNNFPTEFAFWSRPLMVSHNAGYIMWSSDQVSSAGVEKVAEGGSVVTLETEFFTAGSNVNNKVKSVTFNPTGDLDSVAMEGQLEMDNEHTLISAITRITPSPDWFSGLNSYRPVINGMWLSSFTIDSFPWDAGTEDGTEYDTTNVATSPKVNPFQITVGTVPENNVFFNTDEDDVLPVAQWSCNLTPSTTGPTDDTMGGTDDNMATDDSGLSCDEDDSRIFFRWNPARMQIIRPGAQECLWLSQQMPSVQNRHCNRSRNFGPQPTDDTLLAREACPVTCETCPT